MTWKANEAYRLYLSSKENFNTGHPFTAGAYTSSNAFGTTPATDNQTGFQLYNGGPVEVLDESKVQGPRARLPEHLGHALRRLL